jgi:hypothetical protein
MLIFLRIPIPSFYCHIFSCITCFTSCSIIDNIFIDNSRVKPFKVLPIINWLSDHDAQYLTLNNVLHLKKCNNSVCNKSLIMRATISSSVTMLKDDFWSKIIHTQHDINKSLLFIMEDG